MPQTHSQPQSANPRFNESEEAIAALEGDSLNADASSSSSSGSSDGTALYWYEVLVPSRECHLCVGERIQLPMPMGQAESVTTLGPSWGACQDTQVALIGPSE